MEIKLRSTQGLRTGGAQAEPVFLRIGFLRRGTGVASGGKEGELHSREPAPRRRRQTRPAG